MVLHIFHVSLHPTLAFVNGLLMNPTQMILIQCHQFPAGTLIDAMGDIKACMGVDSQKKNLMLKRRKIFARQKVLSGLRGMGGSSRFGLGKEQGEFICCSRRKDRVYELKSRWLVGFVDTQGIKAGLLLFSQ